MAINQLMNKIEMLMNIQRRVHRIIQTGLYRVNVEYTGLNRTVLVTPNDEHRDQSIDESNNKEEVEASNADSKHGSSLTSSFERGN